MKVKSLKTHRYLGIDRPSGTEYEMDTDDVDGMKDHGLIEVQPAFKSRAMVNEPRGHYKRRDMKAS
jgi:hypothetical protein